MQTNPPPERCSRCGQDFVSCSATECKPPERAEWERLLDNLSKLAVKNPEYCTQDSIDLRAAIEQALDRACECCKIGWCGRGAECPCYAAEKRAGKRNG
jgi:hypothetical protein